MSMHGLKLVKSGKRKPGIILILVVCVMFLFAGRGFSQTGTNVVEVTADLSGYYVLPDGALVPVYDCMWYYNHDLAVELNLSNTGQTTVTDVSVACEFQNVELKSAQWDVVGQVDGLTFADQKFHIDTLGAASNLKVWAVFTCLPAERSYSFVQISAQIPETYTNLSPYMYESVSCWTQGGTPIPVDIGMDVNVPEEGIGFGKTGQVTVTATNYGSNIATNVVGLLNVAGGPGLQIDMANGDPGASIRYSFSAVTLNFPDLAPGQSSTIVLNVTPSYFQDINFWGYIDSDCFETKESDNTISKTVKIAGDKQEFDLSVDYSTAYGNGIQENAFNLVFINITNHGPEEASLIDVQLPNALDMDLLGLSNQNYSYFGATRLIHIDSIQPGETLRLPFLASNYYSISGHVKVTTYWNELNKENNECSIFLLAESDSFWLPPEADLAVSQTSNQTTAQIGRQLDYTVTATNQGPNKVSGACLGLLLSGGKIISATCDKSVALLQSDIFSGFGFIDLNPGETATMTVSVMPKAEGGIASYAGITAPNFDPNLSNNVFAHIVGTKKK